MNPLLAELLSRAMSPEVDSQNYPSDMDPQLLEILRSLSGGMSPEMGMGMDGMMGGGMEPTGMGMGMSDPGMGPEMGMPTPDMGAAPAPTGPGMPPPAGPPPAGMTPSAGPGMNSVPGMGTPLANGINPQMLDELMKRQGVPPQGM